MGDRGILILQKMGVSQRYRICRRVSRHFVVCEGSPHAAEEGEEVPPSVNGPSSFCYLLAECSMYIVRDCRRGLLFMLTAA